MNAGLTIATIVLFIVFWIACIVSGMWLCAIILTFMWAAFAAIGNRLIRS